MTVPELSKKVTRQTGQASLIGCESCPLEGSLNLGPFQRAC